MKKLMISLSIFVSICYGAAFDDKIIAAPVQQLFNKTNNGETSISQLMQADIIDRAEVFWSSIQSDNKYKESMQAIDKKKSPSIRLKQWKFLNACVNRLLYRRMQNESIPLEEEERYCAAGDKWFRLEFVKKTAIEGLSAAQIASLKAGKLAWLYYQQERFTKDPEIWHVQHGDIDLQVPVITDLAYDAVHAFIKRNLKELTEEQLASPLGQFFTTLDCRTLVTPELIQKAQQQREIASKDQALSRRLAHVISSSYQTHQKNTKRRHSKDKRAEDWDTYYGIYIDFLAASLAKGFSQPTEVSCFAKLMELTPSQELFDNLSVAYLALALDMQQQQYNVDPQSMRRFIKKADAKPKDLHELPYRHVAIPEGRAAWQMERLKEQMQEIPIEMQESQIAQFYQSFIESGSFQELADDPEVARIALRYFTASQRNVEVRMNRAIDMNLRDFVSSCLDAAAPEMQKDLPGIKFGNCLDSMIKENCDAHIDDITALYLKAGLLSMAMASKSGSKKMSNTWSWDAAVSAGAISMRNEGRIVIDLTKCATQ